VKHRLEILIGFIISAVGGMSSASKLILNFQQEGVWITPAPLVILEFLSVFLPALTLLVFSFLAMKRPALYKSLQVLEVLSLIIVATFAIIDTYEGSYGIALFMISVILCYKYSFLSSFRMVLLFLYITSVTVLSAFRDGRLYSSMLSILFYLFFFSIIYLVFSDSIERVKARNRKLVSLTRYLRKELNESETVERQLNAMRLNVKEFSFTPAEKEVLEALCFKGKTSTKELADYLNKSHGTIKCQINSIFDKTGIHKRSMLIAFFKEVEG